MSTNDSGTVSPGPDQQGNPNTDAASVDPQAGIEAGSTGTMHVQQAGPDTGVRQNKLATRIFRTAGLSQARRLLREEVHYLICLPTEHLWRSYPIKGSLLEEVRSHLVEAGWLSDKDKWGGIDGEEINKEHFAVRGKGATEVKTFAFFSRLFNAVLAYLRQHGHTTSIKEMVNAGSVEPESTRISSHRPDAFLHMTTGASPTPGKFKWRELTCPFEYKFGNGDTIDNDTKALWNLHHIMRSDPRRTFSFGSTVRGTKFRIWLLCRAAPFTFIPFDWFEDPESLLKFFVILATSSETDLGFDTNIQRVGETDFDLQFTIQERVYRTSKLLSDIGAEAPTGRGTWVFEVVDQKTMEVRVIKDCWVEDRPGKQVEHDIVAEIKKSMDDQTFREYFIDICGYRKTDTSGGFDSVCKILEKRTFMPREKFEPQYLVPASVNPKPIYADSARDSIADQDHRLQPTSTKRAPNNPPHPRLRYQVVYEEKGISLFEVTSFAEVFLHIGRATEGLHHLHQAGWVHKDFSPGNVIVVDGKAKISDLEFAKRRAVSQLGELTRPRDPSLLGTRELRTGTLLFIAVEVEEGDYLFRPDPPSKEDSEADEDLNWELPIPRNQKGSDQRTEPPKGDNDVISAMELIERIFLHNPLHDYESVWWIAVWFVFHCKPEGVADEVMEQARDKLYQNRTATFGLNAFEGARKSLPKVLQPLCDVLVVMRKLLVEAYKSFEESFDGSGMLSVARKLMRQVRGLAVLSRDLTVKPPVVHQKLNTESDVKQFVTLGAEQDQLVGEQDIGAGGQPMDTDDPFIDTPAQDPVLGKRKRDSGLRSEVNPALERKLIKDDQTVQP